MIVALVYTNLALNKAYFIEFIKNTTFSVVLVIIPQIVSMELD